MRRRLISALCAGALACAGCGTGDKTTTELLNDLKGSDERDRVVAVRTVSDRKGDAAEVVPALIGALTDREADVRWSAAIKLGSFGEKARDAIPALQSALSDRDARVREAAGKALSRIDPAQYPTPPKGTRPRK